VVGNLLAANKLKVFLTLIGQLAEGWTLVKPVTLTVERDETGAYLASEPVTTVYGYGESGPETSAVKKRRASVLAAPFFADAS
jgi:hypothetical protein